MLSQNLKKRKKQRSRGFYTSPFLKNYIKFVDKAEHLEQKCDEAELVTQATSCGLNNDHHQLLEMCYFESSFWNLSDKDLSAITNFSAVMWHSEVMAVHNLTDCALTFDDQHKMLWLDLHSMNSSPSSHIFQAIEQHFGKSGFGWLSKCVVDCYIFAIVKNSNLEVRAQEFGQLRTDDTACILRKSNFKIVYEFSRNILRNGTKELRNHIFLPFLFNSHFMVLWFDKKANCVTLIDSIARDRSHIISMIERPIMAFLDLFESNSLDMKFCQVTYATKLDSSSCGVSVCMAVDIVCQAVKNNVEPEVKNLAEANIRQYRNWMAYMLYANSSQSSPTLHVVAKATLFDYAVGLDNLGNTCWFNAVIQAIIAIVKKAKAISVGKVTVKTSFGLFNIIKPLLSYEKVA